MRDTTTYGLAIASDTATLTVSGDLAPPDLNAILGRCRELAPHVIQLRVDLRPRGVMSASDNEIVRAVLDAWRARGGSFTLTTAHLVASCRQVAAAPMPVWSPTSSRGGRDRRVPCSPRQLQASY